MQKTVIVLIITLGIVGVASSFFHHNKISKYLKKRGGKLISTKRSRGLISSIKYSDKYGNIHSVSIFYVNAFLIFGDDTIIKYDTSSPEYLKLQEKEMLEKIDLEKKQKLFEEHHYEFNNHQWLTIKQEFAQPNIGEHAYVNSKTAPDGKYKIGFMRYLYIKDGVITEIKMT